jgi:AraC-like DNA-binding protein
MEFLYEKINVPEQNSFMTRHLPIGRQTAYMHSHKNYELNFIVNGHGIRYVGNNISAFSEEDLVLIGPNLPHCWEVLNDQGNNDPTCIVTHFHENFIENSFLKIPELEPFDSLLKESAYGIYFKGPEVQKIKRHLLKMLELEGFSRMLELLHIFNILNHTKEYFFLSTPGYIKESWKGDFEKINKIYDYVSRSFQEEMNLEEVSKLFNLTTTSFCRYFKQKTKRKFFDYVKEVRIGYACRLLVETDEPITYICMKAGYNNIPHFNFQFREIVSCSPREFRLKYRNRKSLLNNNNQKINRSEISSL